MDKNIGVGLIVGLAITTTIFVAKTDKLLSGQKAILYVFVFFPPLQWVSILIFLAYNSYRRQNLPEVLREKQTVKETNNFDENISSLKELRDKEILTEQEYQDKVKNLENSKFEHQLKLTEDYQKLKSLFEDGILTQQEFDSKVKIIKSKLNNPKESINTNEIEKGNEEGIDKLFVVLVVILLLVAITNAMGLW